MEPTNADLKESFDAHAKTDDVFQHETRAFNTEMAMFRAETEGSLAAIHKKLVHVPTKEDTANIVESVIKKLLMSKGKSFFTLIVSTSILFAALGVIFGGFKIVLAWIGFAMVPK